MATHTAGTPISLTMTGTNRAGGAVTQMLSITAPAATME